MTKGTIRAADVDQGSFSFSPSLKKKKMSLQKQYVFMVDIFGKKQQKEKSVKAAILYRLVNILVFSQLDFFVCVGKKTIIQLNMGSYVYNVLKHSFSLNTVIPQYLWGTDSTTPVDTQI